MEYALWLSNIPGIGNAAIRRLTQEGQTAKEIYGMSERRLRSISGITEENIRQIEKSRREWNLQKEWTKLAQRGIGFVSAEQKEYPSRFRMIADPPYSIYYKGRLPDEKQRDAGRHTEARRDLRWQKRWRRRMFQ